MNETENGNNAKNGCKPFGAVILIAEGRTNPVVYEAFSAGFRDKDLEHLQTVEQPEPDEKLGTEYFISLWRHPESGNIVIWCSGGVSPSVEFDSFWIIFPKEHETSARLLLQKIRQHFERSYMADETSFCEGLEEIFDLVERAGMK